MLESPGWSAGERVCPVELCLVQSCDTAAHAGAPQLPQQWSTILGKGVVMEETTVKRSEQSLEAGLQQGNCPEN